MDFRNFVVPLAESVHQLRQNVDVDSEDSCGLKEFAVNAYQDKHAWHVSLVGLGSYTGKNGLITQFKENIEFLNSEVGEMQSYQKSCRYTVVFLVSFHNYISSVQWIFIP